MSPDMTGFDSWINAIRRSHTKENTLPHFRPKKPPTIPPQPPSEDSRDLEEKRIIAAITRRVKAMTIEDARTQLEVDRAEEIKLQTKLNTAPTPLKPGLQRSLDVLRLRIAALLARVGQG